MDTGKSMDSKNRRDASKSKEAFTADTFEKTGKPKPECMEANDRRDAMDASKNMNVWKNRV